LQPVGSDGIEGSDPVWPAVRGDWDRFASPTCVR